ncbi:unnamed protein product [Prorocentrum cordatum]|uniref:RRM domain-containing protein n=1 Tax=Prorocentrum cordatum TaxID=2364126 RepID=A0ABN9XW47_9DINO|nr:unnamed protein product [Polarella glacialis]
MPAPRSCSPPRWHQGCSRWPPATASSSPWTAARRSCEPLATAAVQVRDQTYSIEFLTEVRRQMMQAEKGGLPKTVKLPPGVWPSERQADEPEVTGDNSAEEAVEKGPADGKSSSCQNVGYFPSAASAKWEGPADPLCGKIFVGRLDLSTTEETIRSHFSWYGTVIDCHLERGWTGLSRGFGFVLFDNAASAKKAVEEDGHRIDGRWVECKRYVPQAPAAARGSCLRADADAFYPSVPTEEAASPADILEQDALEYTGVHCAWTPWCTEGAWSAEADGEEEPAAAWCAWMDGRPLGAAPCGPAEGVGLARSAGARSPVYTDAGIRLLFCASLLSFTSPQARESARACRARCLLHGGY